MDNVNNQYDDYDSNARVRANAARFFSIGFAPAYLKSPRLYERKPVTDLWNKLTSVCKQQWKWKNVPLPDKKNPVFGGSQPRILQVRGPPGCGKSSATYYWVSSVCRLENTQAVWISCANADGRAWTIKRDASDNTVKATQRAVPLSQSDTDFADIVVFDGVRATTLEQWRGLMNDLARTGIPVVVVSSEGVFFHAGDSQDIISLGHFVPSWIMPEYLEACRDDQFWGSCYYHFNDASQNDNLGVRNGALIEKFEKAGHSARFMFKKPERWITAEIKQKALAMGGIDSLEAATRADRSAGAVNTIVARIQTDKNGLTPDQQAVFPAEEDLTNVATSRQDLDLLDTEWDNEDSSPRLLSALAAAEVLKVIPSSVERLRNVGRALENQAIEGYALELQLKKKLNEAKHPGRYLVLSHGSISLAVSSVLFCEGGDVLEMLKTHHDPDTWIFIAGRQGAFDAIHVVSNTHIRFVQVTAGKRHSFKLDILDGFMTTLGMAGLTWSHLEFMIVRPEDDHRPFSLLTTRGRLQNYRRFDEEQWHRADYRDNVQYATLDWD